VRLRPPQRRKAVSRKLFLKRTDIVSTESEVVDQVLSTPPGARREVGEMRLKTTPVLVQLVKQPS
jgi:hypothetical protein